MLETITDPLGRSLFVATVASLGALIAALLLARLRVVLERSLLRSGRSIGTLMDVALLLPVALPPSAIGLLLLWGLGRASVIGQWLESIGLVLVFSVPAAVVAAFVVATPLMYQGIRATFVLIDEELLDSARLCGVGEWQLLWRFMIPLAWPGVVASFVTGFLRAIGEFGATLLLAGNIPGRTQTLPIALFSAYEQGEDTLAFALVGVIVGISVVLLIVSQWVPRFARQ